MLKTQDVGPFCIRRLATPHEVIFAWRKNIVGVHFIIIIIIIMIIIIIINIIDINLVIVIIVIIIIIKKCDE